MYVLILERLERHVLAERHVAAVLMAGGAKKVTVPTFTDERGKLDRMLGDRPARKHRTPEQQRLLAAIGLGD